MTNELSRSGASSGCAADASPSSRAGNARIVHAIAHDADEQAHNLHGWRQTYDQLSAGPFTGTLAELFLDRMTVFREVTSHALRQTCRVDSDAYWFGIPICREDVGHIDGRAIGGDMVAFRPGGVEFELMTPPGYEFFGVVVKGELLRRHMAYVEHLELTGHAPAIEVIGTTATRKARLYSLLQPLVAEGTSTATMPLTRVARDHLQSSILEALFELCAPGHAQPLEAATLRRRALVSQARDYVIANRERAVSVPELCEKLHVSRRTLQYCFQHVLGMSPAAYLHALRLNGARRDLCRARLETADASAARSVQDIAAAWGFWHLSQFATDYRRLFGLRPSDTLKPRP